MTAAAEAASIGPEGTLSGAKQMTATHGHMKVPPSYTTHLKRRFISWLWMRLWVQQQRLWPQVSWITRAGPVGQLACGRCVSLLNHCQVQPHHALMKKVKYMVSLESKCLLSSVPSILCQCLAPSEVYSIISDLGLLTNITHKWLFNEKDSPERFSPHVAATQRNRLLSVL